MNQSTVMALAVAALSMAVGAAGELVQLDQAGAAAWRRELMPLPHEISIAEIRKIKPAEVGIRGRPGAAGLEQIAVSNVVALFREKAGIEPAAKNYEILIGLMDEQGRLDGIEVPAGARLKDVPNSDQAYVIQPVGADRLVVAAVNERGLYYGTRTLAQWLERHLTPAQAEIPVACIVDWPDLEERGFWHMPAKQIPWLASLKMNRFFLSVRFSVDEAGVHPDPPDILARQAGAEWISPFDHAREYGAELVRGTSHYDYWEKNKPGYLKFYPELPGKGDAAWNPASREAGGQQRVPCASNPDLVKILTVVMADLAAQRASEVMIWMSEYPAAHCECENCVKTGQYVAEVKAAIAAWESAKKSYPHLKLSVFFGRGGLASARHPLTERYPDEEIKTIMDILPPDVAMRPSMGCDGPDGRLLADYAGSGKRISRMNVVSLTAAYRSEHVRARMQQIVDGKYIGAWQFTPGAGGGNPDKFYRQYRYQLCALAEYSWNASGRTAGEFAEAWACRQGYADPAGFVAWIAAMDMPQAVRLPKCWPSSGLSWFNNLAQMARDKKWDDSLVNPDELPAGALQAGRALKLAEKLNAPDLIAQSQLLLAYCRLEQAGHDFIASLSDQYQAGAARQAFDRLQDMFNLYLQTRLASNREYLSEYMQEQARQKGAVLGDKLAAVEKLIKGVDNDE